MQEPTIYEDSKNQNKEVKQEIWNNSIKKILKNNDFQKKEKKLFDDVLIVTLISFLIVYLITR
jgi:hypothetical protein